MEKYIRKSALVAEIDKFMYGANLEADIASTGECFNEKIAEAKHQLCKQIKDKINTLEVKEVDLRKPYDGIKVQTSYRGNSLDEVIVKTTYKAQKGE